MNIKKLEDLEFEIFVLRKEIEEVKNEEDKYELKNELKKVQQKYNKMKKVLENE